MLSRTPSDREPGRARNSALGVALPLFCATIVVAVYLIGAVQNVMTISWPVKVDGHVHVSSKDGKHKRKGLDASVSSLASALASKPTRFEAPGYTAAPSGSSSHASPSNSQPGPLQTEKQKSHGMASTVGSDVTNLDAVGQATEPDLSLHINRQKQHRKMHTGPQVLGK